MLIGLTGRTGSGKSSAAEFFINKGACVVDCDSIAHKVLEDENIKNELKKYFPPEIFDSSGKVIRQNLGRIVFSDPQKLSVLNSIVHPEVIRRSLEIISASGKKTAVLDGSELDTSGIDKKCRHIIVLESDEEIRLKRIMQRDGIDRDSALKRINAQHDYSEKCITVKNNASRAELFSELEIIYNRIMEEDNA